MEENSSVIEKEIGNIWQMGHDMGISDLEIDNIFNSALEVHKNRKIDNKKKSITVPAPIRITKTILKIFLIVNILIVVVGTLTSIHNPTKKFITRNIQDIIYPFMTNLRHVTLPILLMIPKLSTWYTEECLVNNPLYSPGDNDCSICSGSINVERISSIKNIEHYSNSGRLIIIPDALEHEVIWTELLKKIDLSEEEKNGMWKSNIVEQPKHNHISNKFHAEWRVDRLKSLHIVRDHFPTPYFISGNTEIALIRHLYIDGLHAESYDLPSLEFTNMFIIQGHGSSTFLVKPSHQCKGICNSVKVTLLPKEALFYNSIYWQPVRMKSPAEIVSFFVTNSFY